MCGKQPHYGQKPHLWTLWHPFSIREGSLCLTKACFHCSGISVAAHPPQRLHTENSSFPAQPCLCRQQKWLLVTVLHPQNAYAQWFAQILHVHPQKAKLLQREFEQGPSVKKLTDLLPRGFLFLLKPPPSKSFNPFPSLSRENAMLQFHWLQVKARNLSSPDLQTQHW